MARGVGERTSESASRMDRYRALCGSRTRTLPRSEERSTTDRWAKQEERSQCGPFSASLPVLSQCSAYEIMKALLVCVCVWLVIRVLLHLIAWVSLLELLELCR